MSAGLSPITSTPLTVTWMSTPIEKKAQKMLMALVRPSQFEM
jgi:hypothetical protein